MKPKPIIITPPSVKLIFEGKKTMTRQLLKSQPDDRKLGGYILDSTGRDRRRGDAIFYRGDDAVIGRDYLYARPRYAVGDILYVKETHWRWGVWECVDGHWRFQARESMGEPVVLFDAPTKFDMSGFRDMPGYHKRPSIFMPRDLARLFLRVTEERAEQLNDITPADARAEGAVEVGHFPTHNGSGRVWCGDIVAGFKLLWASIHGKKSPWKRNDWVWVYGFERIEEEETTQNG